MDQHDLGGDPTAVREVRQLELLLPFQGRGLYVADLVFHALAPKRARYPLGAQPDRYVAPKKQNTAELFAVEELGQAETPLAVSGQGFARKSPVPCRRCRKA